jgi:hypothetical protein
VTLESNGASIASGSLAVASVTYYDVVANGSSYPDAEFVLAVTFGTAPTEGATINLYAQPLSISGTSSAEVPETTRPTVPIGSFTVNNVTTTQYIVLNGIYAMDVPKKANYYLHNNGTGQAMSAGWTLTVTPRSRKAAP